MTTGELALVLASALLHALWSTSIKGSRDPLVFNFYQGGVTLALAAVVIPLLDFGEITAHVWRWLAITSVAHALYFYWLTRAFLSPAARFAALTLAATLAYGLTDKAAMAELARGPWSSPVPRALA